MRASVVVPTYNMANELAWSLEFLAQQELEPGTSIETLVVDDGSNDTTVEVVRHFASSLDIKYLHRPRDDESCRARARNLGLQAAMGALCILLDSGVIIEPTFVRDVLRRYRADPNRVWIHPILGLFATNLPFERAELSPATLRERFASLASEEEWADIREPLFASVDDDLARLPAPWGLGWTCALSVPRSRALEVGGFDETFQGWGAEDIDFSYRLWRAGAAFAVSRDALCLHIPHGGSLSSARKAEHRRNQLALHRRDYALETELNVLLGSIGCNIFASRLQRLAALSLVPRQGRELLTLLDGERMGTLAVVDAVLTDAALRSLTAATVFVNNERDLAAALRRVPDGVEVVRSFCCETPYPDNAFGTILLGDALRLFPTPLQLAQLRECARIAGRVLLLCTRGEEPTDRRARYRECDGWRWSSEAELHALAERAGWRLRVAKDTPRAALFRLEHIG
jgi:glycosyltransferase involved in cell wall biosynthesis